MTFKEKPKDQYDFPGRIKVQERINKPKSLFQKVMESKKTPYEEERLIRATELAEIDYMLRVIEKNEVEKTIKRYETYNLSGLITILVKRLGDFAEAETHRDFNS